MIKMNIYEDNVNENGVNIILPGLYFPEEVGYMKRSYVT